MYYSHYKRYGNWSYYCLSLINGLGEEVFIHFRMIYEVKIEMLMVCDGKDCHANHPDNERQMFPVSERVAKAINATPGFNALVHAAYDQYRKRRAA